MSIWAYIGETLPLFQFRPLAVNWVSVDVFHRAKIEAKQVLSVLDMIYPPNASGLARILPWNWDVEPLAPETDLTVPSQKLTPTAARGITMKS